MTLLVNSKTPWMVTLHPTVKGQKACGYCVKQRSLMCLEIQWLDLPNRVKGYKVCEVPLPEIRGTGPQEPPQSAQVHVGL
jgi:hypothetical protein